ncbi:MFS transporter [Candidatus Woesearchaeota archaeon]|nr:MFS transporter [Candidatus Woesearchaeota archaeon]
MLNIHRKHRKLSRGKELSFLGLFVAIGLACIDSIWALYMNGFGLSESRIGFISAFLVILSILFTIFSTPIIEYFKQTKILFFSLISSVVAYFFIGLVDSLSFFLAMAALLTISGILRVECLDILFRDNTPKKDLNKEEGFLYSLLNLGWLIGPLIAGFFMLKFNLASVFFVSAFFFLIS